MTKKRSLHNLPLLVLILLFLSSACTTGYETLGANTNPDYDPSEGPFKIAMQKDDITTYRKFIHNHPNSTHISKAIERLGELLVGEGEKEALEAYVKTFPNYRHKVAEALEEIQLLEKVNEHMNEIELLTYDRSKIKIRRGEHFYSYHYYKAFVKLEDAMGMDADYEIRIDGHKHPDFIQVILMPGVSFAMEESFHALSNVRYKIVVSQSAPLGKYKLEIIFGTYRLENNEWVRRDGSNTTHEIEIVANEIIDPQEPQVDFRAIGYFAEKEAEAKQLLKRLRPPSKEDFGEHYMYAYNMAQYTVWAEKFHNFRAIAYYHLKKASQSSTPEISQKAKQYLNQLGSLIQKLEFIPYEIGG